MFRGKKCTDRCMNSISILKRQPKASKLESCYCEGTEDFDCQAIKTNMDRLCFKPPEDDLTNEIDVDGSKASGSSSWTGQLDKVLILFTIIVTLVVNWVGTSFSVMADHLRGASEEQASPPEEIGVH